MCVCCCEVNWFVVCGGIFAFVSFSLLWRPPCDMTPSHVLLIHHTHKNRVLPMSPIHHPSVIAFRDLYICLRRVRCRSHARTHTHCRIMIRGHCVRCHILRIYWLPTAFFFFFFHFAEIKFPQRGDHCHSVTCHARDKIIDKRNVHVQDDVLRRLGFCGGTQLNNKQKDLWHFYLNQCLTVAGRRANANMYMLYANTRSMCKRGP